MADSRLKRKGLKAIRREGHFSEFSDSAGREWIKNGPRDVQAQQENGPVLAVWPAGEVDDKGERRRTGIGDLLDSMAPAFDGPAEFGVYGNGQIDDETIARPANFAEIVGDQNRAFLDQTQCEGGFARTGGTAKQNASPLDRNGGSLELKSLAHTAGRMMVKRAPVEAPDVSTRFSAKMRPPWASMIWREMLRPRPEWVPNFSPAGRSV